MKTYLDYAAKIIGVPGPDHLPDGLVSMLEKAANYTEINDGRLRSRQIVAVIVLMYKMKNESS